MFTKNRRFRTGSAKPRGRRGIKPAVAPQPPHAAPASPTEPYAGLMFPPSAVADLWQYVEVLRSGARDDEDEANFRLGRAARKHAEADTLVSLLRRAEHEAAEPVDGLELGLYALLPPVEPLRHYTPSSAGFRPVCGAVSGGSVYTAGADIDCPACRPLMPEWLTAPADPTADTLTMHAVPAGGAR